MISGAARRAVFPDSCGVGRVIISFEKPVAYAKTGIKQHRIVRPKRKGAYGVRHLDLAPNQLGRTRITIAGHPEKTRLVSTIFTNDLDYLGRRGYETKVFEGDDILLATLFNEVDRATYKTRDEAVEGHGRFVKKWVSKE